MDFDRWLKATEDSPAYDLQTPPWRDIAMSECCDQTTEKRSRAAQDLPASYPENPARPDTPSSSTSISSCIELERMPLQTVSQNEAGINGSAESTTTTSHAAAAVDASPIDKLMQLMVVSGSRKPAEQAISEPGGDACRPYDSATRKLFGVGSDEDDSGSTYSSAASESSDEFISVNELAGGPFSRSHPVDCC